MKKIGITQLGSVEDEIHDYSSVVTFPTFIGPDAPVENVSFLLQYPDGQTSEVEGEVSIIDDSTPRRVYNFYVEFKGLYQRGMYFVQPLLSGDGFSATLGVQVFTIN